MKIINDDVVIIPLWWNFDLFASSQRVNNFAAQPSMWLAVDSVSFDSVTKQ